MGVTLCHTQVRHTLAISNTAELWMSPGKYCQNEVQLILFNITEFVRSQSEDCWNVLDRKTQQDSEGFDKHDWYSCYESSKAGKFQTFLVFFTILLS